MPQPRRGRPEAAAAIWNWREAAQAAIAAPSAARVRIRGALQGAFGVAAGALLFHFVSQTLGTIVCAIGGSVVLAALVSPLGLFAAIDGAFHAVGRLLARGLTWLLMPAIFYLLFLPFGLLFRRGRRDAMKRYYDSEATSYWTVREQQRPSLEARGRKF